MKDPRRLLDEGADDFEARLLAAGRGDAVSSRSRARILAGLGLGALLPSTAIASGAKGAAEGGLAWLGFGVTAKVVAGGALGALAVWSGVQLLSPPHPPVEVPMASGVVEPDGPKPEPVLAEVVEEPDQVDPPVAPLTKPTGAKPVRPVTEGRADDLGRELASLDEARAALRRGNPNQAVQLLDEHRREFPKQRLRVEATVLRIEALSARGDRAEAERLGKDFLAKHPNGPYAKRVRSLLGASPEPSEPDRPE